MQHDRSQDLKDILACLQKMGLQVMRTSRSDVYYIDGLRHTSSEILKIWG